MKIPTEEPPESATHWAQRLTDLLAAIGMGAIVVIAVHALNHAPPGSTAQSAVGDSADLCRSVDEGFLSGHLYGAVDRAIEWRGTDMKCEGGARPGDEGLRLVFAAPADVDADRLVFVIGITGTIDDLSDSELGANVTIIDETTGRFFSSGRQERCWTTVASVAGDGETYAIDGAVYCSGSLPSLSDASSVSLSEFRYSGRLMIDAS